MLSKDSRVNREEIHALTSLLFNCFENYSSVNIFNLPVLKPRIYDTSSLGAAMDAAVGTGLHPDFDTAVDRMTHVETVIEPDAGRAAHYHELYHEVYKHVYEKLKPYYKKIRKITGYPD